MNYWIVWGEGFFAYAIADALKRNNAVSWHFAMLLGCVTSSLLATNINRAYNAIALIQYIRDANYIKRVDNPVFSFSETTTLHPASAPAPAIDKNKISCDVCPYNKKEGNNENFLVKLQYADINDIYKSSNAYESLIKKDHKYRHMFIEGSDSGKMFLAPSCFGFPAKTFKTPDDLISTPGDLRSTPPIPESLFD